MNAPASRKTAGWGKEGVGEVGGGVIAELTLLDICRSAPHFRDSVQPTGAKTEGS